MIQTNNADLGKAFPGGMEDMVPGKASFFVFCMAWPSEVYVYAFDAWVQPFPAIGRLNKGQVGLATTPGFSFVLEFSIC